MVRSYLVDTNIIIDMLLDREHADAACAVIDKAEQGEIVVYLSALSYTNIYYSLRKYLSHEERVNSLILLQEVIKTLSVDSDVIADALRSDWKDFEDAVQYFSAKSNKDIVGIITRNEKDFVNSELPVLSPYSFMRK